LADAAKVGGRHECYTMYCLFGRFEEKSSVKPCGAFPAADQGKKDVARRGFGLGDADLGRPSEVLLRDNGCVCPNRDMGFE
jgi:hypothetical protein